MLAEMQSLDSNAKVSIVSYVQESTFSSGMSQVSCSDWPTTSSVTDAQNAKLALADAATAINLGLSSDSVVVSASSCSRRRMLLDRFRRRLSSQTITLATVATSSTDLSAQITSGLDLKSNWNAAKAVVASDTSVPASVRTASSSVAEPTANAAAPTAVSYKTTIKTAVVAQSSAASQVSTKLSSGFKTVLQSMPSLSGVTIAVTQVTAAPTAAPTAEDSSSAGVIIGIIVAVILVGGIAVGVFLSMKSKAPVGIKQGVAPGDPEP